MTPERRKEIEELKERLFFATSATWSMSIGGSDFSDEDIAAILAYVKELEHTQKNIEWVDGAADRVLERVEKEARAKAFEEAAGVCHGLSCVLETYHSRDVARECEAAIRKAADSSPRIGISPCCDCHSSERKAAGK